MIPCASHDLSAIPNSSYQCIGDNAASDFAPLIAPHWRQFRTPSPILHYVLGSVYIVLTVVSLIANGLVITVYACRRLPSPSNLFIMNLAVCDFLMMLKTPIFIINSFHQGPYFGKWGCNIYGCVGGLSGLGAIWFLAAVAFERYRAIKNPLDRHKRLTRSDAKKIIISIWSMAISCSVAPLLGWNRYVPEGYLTSCSFDYLTKEWSSLSFVILLTIVAWFCPLVVIIYSYSQMVNSIRQNRSLLQRFSRHKDQPEALNKIDHLSSKYARQNLEMKVAKIAVLLIGMWVFAWTPYAVVALIGAFSDRSHLTPLSSMLPALACKLSAVLNPFVYVFRNAKFRIQLRRLLVFAFRRNQFNNSKDENISLKNYLASSFIRSKSLSSNEIL